MKKQLPTLLLLICITTGTLCQVPETINSSNYYRFQTNAPNLNWLRSSDAVPIIIDELLKSGIAYHTLSVGRLIKINDSARMVVTVSFEKGKQFGFLYEASHGLPLNVKDREFLTNRNQAAYVQAEYDLNDAVAFKRIEPLPANVFFLKQRVYWFEYDNTGTKFPVPKVVAQNILREDIRQYLKSIP